jgi:aryl-alcohol dehydrogenase-like predicted oxidoreductase
MIKTINNTPVFPIAMGGAAIGSCPEQIFFGSPINDKQAVDTVLCALDNGINLIDTSPFYGNSEYKIGLALREYGSRESLILSTKVGRHKKFSGYTAELFLRSIEDSLNFLQVDYLDIVHIHDPNEDNFKTAMSKKGGMELLLKLKEQGVIRYIGLGVRSHSLHREFINTGVANVILPYLDFNLLSQSAKSLLEEAKKHHINVLLGSPLCMGLLSGVNPANVRVSHYNITNDISTQKACEIYQWCLKRDLDVLALNLKFILRSHLVDAVLLGAASPQEVSTALKAYQSPIGDEHFIDFLEKFTKTID